MISFGLSKQFNQLICLSCFIIDWLSVRISIQSNETIDTLLLLLWGRMKSSRFIDVWCQFPQVTALDDGWIEIDFHSSKNTITKNCEYLICPSSISSFLEIYQTNINLNYFDHCHALFSRGFIWFSLISVVVTKIHLDC